MTPLPLNDWELASLYAILLIMVLGFALVLWHEHRAQVRRNQRNAKVGQNPFDLT